MWVGAEWLKCDLIHSKQCFSLSNNSSGLVIHQLLEEQIKCLGICQHFNFSNFSDQTGEFLSERPILYMLPAIVNVMVAR